MQLKLALTGLTSNNAAFRLFVQAASAMSILPEAIRTLHDTATLIIEWPRGAMTVFSISSCAVSHA